MRTYELKRREVNVKELIKKSAHESDTDEVISEPTIFTENGTPVIVYGSFEGNLEPVRQACKTIKYDSSDRTGGLKTVSRIFGFKPRRIIRGDFCSSTSLARESPKEHELFCSLGRELSRLYQLNMPEQFAYHEDLVHEKILPEWKIPGTIFSSGIINQNNSLKYHLDSGNFKDCRSCMVVLKKGIEGGMLSLPEFNIRLDLKDKSYLIFDGQSILHGVTPILKETKFSYRYSLVFYTLQQMCNCLPMDEELKRIRVVKKAREEKRLDKNRTDL